MTDELLTVLEMLNEKDYEIIQLKKELKTKEEFIQNYKEAAEFWKEKYDSYYKEMDSFLDRTNAILNMILKKQKEGIKSMEDILEKLKTTEEASNWIKKN